MYRIKEKIADFIFPARCPFCDGILPFGGGPVCAVCAPKLSFQKAPFCRKCGKSLRGKGASFCGDCLRYFHEFEENRALFSYDDFTRPSVYRLKYSNRREYANTFAVLTKEKLGDWIEMLNPDLIIPVPLHRSRLRKRGYNQAALYGTALARLTGIPFDDRLAVRVKKTIPQKELTRAQREKNLKKAFKIRQNDVKLSTVLLVDDIYTTGSTLDALAKELKEVLGCRVYSLTIAIGADQGGMEDAGSELQKMRMLV